MWWSDITRTTGSLIESAHLADCVTDGIVYQSDSKVLKLTHSTYADGEGDTTTIHPGCVTKAKTLVTKEKLEKI